MTSTTSVEGSPLRRRMIEDMCVRKFGEKTQYDYIRHIEQFAKFLAARRTPRPARICAVIRFTKPRPAFSPRP
jgi:hypothetical protein